MNAVDVYRNRGLNRHEKSVLVLILSFEYKQGDWVYLTLDDMREMLDIKSRTPISNAVNSLKKKGYLIVDTKMFGMKKRNIYRVDRCTNSVSRSVFDDLRCTLFVNPLLIYPHFGRRLTNSVLTVNTLNLINFVNTYTSKQDSKSKKGNKGNRGQIPKNYKWEVELEVEQSGLFKNIKPVSKKKKPTLEEKVAEKIKQGGILSHGDFKDYWDKQHKAILGKPSGNRPRYEDTHKAIDALISHWGIPERELIVLVPKILEGWKKYATFDRLSFYMVSTQLQNKEIKQAIAHATNKSQYTPREENTVNSKGVYLDHIKF